MGGRETGGAATRAAPVVRPRRAGDTRAVRRVARRTWRATYEAFAPAAFIAAVLRRGYGRRRLVEGLADPRRDAFVAEREGRLVGYADILVGSEGTADLVRLYVLPEEQGAGAGRALLDACVRAVQERGLDRLDVEVDAENGPALRWYERRGFLAAGDATFGVGRWSRPQRRLALALDGGIRGPG